MSAEATADWTPLPQGSCSLCFSRDSLTSFPRRLGVRLITQLMELWEESLTKKRITISVVNNYFDRHYKQPEEKDNSQRKDDTITYVL